MAKANSLKDSMKGGLNALLTSTTPKEAPATTQSTAPKKGNRCALQFCYKQKHSHSHEISCA